MAERVKELEESAAAFKGRTQKPDQAPQAELSALAPLVGQARGVGVPPVLGRRPADILAMQPVLGNRAVGRMLASQVPGSAVGSPPMIQAKLTVGPASDSHRSEDLREPSDEVVRAAATEGIRTPVVTLPFHDQIQASFGRYSVGHVRAHAGAEAAHATRAMNAQAFASGDHVVFGGTPDLRTVAHEAAHTVQQQGGVDLAGGIGRKGDVYERHADDVADAVAAGRSAEGLLEPFVAVKSTEGSERPGVQRVLLYGDNSIDKSTKDKYLTSYIFGKRLSDPALFDMAEKKWKSKGIKGDENRQKFMKDRHDAMLEMIDSDEKWIIESIDDLKQAVAEYMAKRARNEGKEVQVVPKGEISEDMEALMKGIIDTKRAFPEDRIRSVAIRASAPQGHGFKFELELAYLALQSNPECKVQFGSVAQKLIPDILGGEIGHFSGKNPGSIGGDLTVWEPIKKGEVGKFRSDVMQAKSVDPEAIVKNIRDARNQLAGTGASGNADTGERALKGGEHRGTIYVEIHLPIGQQLERVKDEAKDALLSEGSFVTRIVVIENFLKPEPADYVFFKDGGSAFMMTRPKGPGQGQPTTVELR